MMAFDWKPFLQRWSQAVLATGLASAFPAEARVSGWIGYGGATQAEIAQVETRLKTKLPPSYREFLQVTNGWRMVVPFLGRLWSTGEVEWLKTRRPGFIADWSLGEEMFGSVEPASDEEYFRYGDDQDSTSLRSEYLQTALEISDLDAGDGAIYLLNPRIVTPEGEWEAWYFASWLPGATRYRSFGELMQAEYERFLEAMAQTREYTPRYLAHVRERLQPAEPTKQAVNLPALLQALQDEIDVLRSPAKPEPGKPRSLPLFQQRMAEALEFAQARVRELQSQVKDSDKLRRKLSALADELDDLGRKGMRAAMRDFDLGKALKAGMLDKLTGSVAHIDQQFQSSGTSGGYRTAAGILRIFLGNG